MYRYRMLASVRKWGSSGRYYHEVFTLDSEELIYSVEMASLVFLAHNGERWQLSHIVGYTMLPS